MRPTPALATARTVYMLQGAVVAEPARLVAQRPAIPHLSRSDVWMVVRVETLDWTPRITDQILTSVERWRAAGNRLVGVQIDFDARTRHLGDYAAFLKAFRARLPHRYRLGITGLLDWSANGDPQGLEAIAGVVDEVVLQIYQGRHVIRGYAAYLARLHRLSIPFRIGLLEGGEWEAPGDLASNPRFRGYVVFLTNGCHARCRPS